MENRLHSVLNEMAVPGRSAQRQALVNYGRKLFAVMNRTRNKPKDKREQMLKDVRLRLKMERLVSAKAAARVESAIVELFRNMEQAGELDWLPPVREAGRLAALPNRKRVNKDEELCADEWKNKVRRWENARLKFINKVTSEVKPLLAEAGIPENRHLFYLNAVRQCWHIAIHSMPDSEQRNKLVEDFLVHPSAKGCNPELLRRVAELFFRRYEQEKHSFPPDPWAKKA